VAQNQLILGAGVTGARREKEASPTLRDLDVREVLIRLHDLATAGTA